MSAVHDAPPPDAREPVLVVTKLHPPRPRPGHVARPRLVARLRDGAGGRVTLVRAPAGGGKTTLLSEWLAGVGDAIVGWVSLDGDDDDPVRFWTYVLEALRVAGLPAVANLVPTLWVPAMRATDVVLPQLVNLLAGVDRRVVLVLDDLHEVGSPQVHEDLRFLIDRLPEGVHVCLASRTDPPAELGLTRLRGGGEVTDIRAEDLRFDTEHAARLLSAAVGRALAPDEVHRLQERTEGWAVGLYLAGLSLREGTARGTAADVSGDERHLADYLTSEFLGGLDGPARDFLVRTSVLRRLCGPLCDHVLGTSGSSARLEVFERSNALVVPLDNRRRWFRYHHLFGDLLRVELERQAGSGEIAELHDRAACWWEDEGDVPEAIHHALAAEDVERAARLVGMHWHEYMERGRLATVRGWLDSLPEAAQGRADLLLARAWVELNSGRPEYAGRAVDAAEALSEGPTPPGLPPVRAAVPMLRAVLGYMTGDLDASIASARRALEVADRRSPWAAIPWAVLGTSLLWHPDGDGDADEALSEAIERSTPGENAIAVLHAHAARGLLRLDAGERAAATEALGRASEVSESENLEEYSWASLAAALRGRLLEDDGDLATAADAYGRAVMLAARGRIVPEQAYGLIRLARVQSALGDGASAAGSLREARRVLAAAPEPGVILYALQAAERGTPLASLHDEELTQRELVVLRMLGSSLTQAELASSLYVSVNTLKTHVRTIYRKLGAGSREEAVARGRERGLL